MKNLKSIFSRSLSTLLIKVLGFASTYLIYWLLPKVFSLEAVGNYSLLTSIYFIISSLGTLGFDRGILVLANRYVQYKNQIFSFMVLCTALISVLICTVFTLFDNELSALFSDTGDLNILMTGTVPVIGFLILCKIFSGLMRLENNMIMFALLNETLQKVVFACSLFFFWWIWSNETFHLDDLGKLYLASNILVFIVGFFWIRNNLVKPWPIDFLRDIFRVSAPINLSSLVGVLSRYTDLLLVGYFLLDTEVGLYAAAAKLAILNSLVLISVNAVVGSDIAKFYHDNNMDDFKLSIRKSTSIIFWATLPISIILIGFPGEMLSILDADYIEGKEALRILAISQMVSAFFGPVGLILQMTAYQKNFQSIVLIALLLNVTMSMILIPIMGLKGAALSSFISLLFSNVFAAILVNRKFNILTIYNPFKLL